MRNLTRLELASNQIDEDKKKSIKLGQYTICFDKLLGKGAFSSVYLCEGPNKKIAAVKIISKEKNKSEHAVTIAKSQARILKPLEHENIVKLLDSYESSRNFYILLKYYEGKTLKDVINSQFLLSKAQKLSIVSQLVTIFRYLHYRNIIHRDIKPDNIKLGKNNKIVLLDFGFAKELLKGEETELTDWVGTPSYMSPQMLSKTKYTAKSDIWSLGILTYQLFYGDVPFKGKDEQDLLKKITNNPLIFPKKPFISQTTKQFIRCCLKQNPERRISWNELFMFDNVKAFHESEKDQICCKC